MTGWLLLAQLAVSMGQPSVRPAVTRAAWLVEAGGYAWRANEDLGWWRGAQLQVRWRGGGPVQPALFVESQTRPSGTQIVSTLMATIDMAPAVYAVASASFGTNEEADTRWYPERRFDAKVHWKVPRDRQTVLGAGYTRFEVGPASGDIYNAGVLLYRGRLIVEANGFLNVSHPGSLTSGAASLAAQHGAEGKMWAGIAVGVGRELYRSVLTPDDVSRRSVTLTGFARRWITPRSGVHLTVEYQDKHEAWRRAGAGVRFFWEF